MIANIFTNNKKACIVLGVGLLVYTLVGLWAWFFYRPSAPAKHIGAVVEQHKSEVKELERSVAETRKETDEKAPQTERLDIDALVDWFNDWLLRQSC